MYNILCHFLTISGGFTHNNFPLEGGDQNGLGLPAKHRGAENVVDHVPLTSLQWVESFICRSLFVYLASVRYCYPQFSGNLTVGEVSELS